jgi:hypothetical protein
MSLDTWLEEFYPVSAEDCVDENTIGLGNNEIALRYVQHAVKKWSGLKEENLDRHNVCIDDMTIVDKKNPLLRFFIDGDSCVLCYKFSYCVDCPIVDYCGVACYRGEPSPWREFAHKGNPYPMIDTLDKTLTFYLKKVADDKKSQGQ